MQLIGGSSFLTRPMEPGCDTRCEYQRCCGTRLEPQRPIDPLRAVKIRRLYCDESTEDGGREPASAPGNERSHESTREGAQRCEHGREDQHRRFALPHTTSLLRGRLLSTPGATGASTTVRRNEYVLRQVVSCWLLPSRNRQLASRVAAQDAIGNLTCPPQAHVFRVSPAARCSAPTKSYGAIGVRAQGHGRLFSSPKKFSTVSITCASGVSFSTSRESPLGPFSMLAVLTG